MLYNDIIQAIGKTPLVRLNKITPLGGEKRIYVKAEFMNPGGSIKDRTAFTMLNEGLKSGKINRDTLIIEPTSGNTGIGLGMICAVLGLKLVLTMPDTMSVERRKILSAYGAEIVLTEGKLGMSGAIQKAEELREKTPNSYIPSQFTNLDNRLAHFRTTAPEIFEDLESVACIVGGVGTGGTLGGIRDYIISRNLKTKIVAVEPTKSAVLSGETAGAHGLQGIGAGFIPEIVKEGDFDEIVKVSESEAYEYARKLSSQEGMLVGITAGASLCAAIKISQKTEGNIVVILPDTGMRYLSTELYE